MCYSHFHIVYSESVSTAIKYFTYLSFTASNARLGRVNSMHLGSKIFGVHKAIFWRRALKLMKKEFEHVLLLVLVWVGAVYSQFSVHHINVVRCNFGLQFTWDHYGCPIVL